MLTCWHAEANHQEHWQASCQCHPAVPPGRGLHRTFEAIATSARSHNVISCSAITTISSLSENV